MKTIKTIDLYVNIVLMASCSIAILLNQVNLIKTYFVVGGWQVLSMIVHTLNGWFMKKGVARRVFHRTVIVILSIVLLGQVLTPFLFIFFFLLVGSPVLAMIYSKICYDELNEIKTTNSLSLK